ncbi:MAG: AhpC/TSA family protein [Bacteroidales bacterium]|jgi:thiol-disulfide isomerase/thioredoxin|nr:AhpC/TSA family protein [Bacteroidales bacterium]
MKKLFFGSVVIITLMVFISCEQKSNQLTLNGTGLSVDNDIYVYDMAENNTIDTIKVSKGEFAYTYVVVEPKILVLTDNQTFNKFVIAEKGNLILVSDTGSITGSPLNNRLAAFSKMYRNTGSELEQKNQAIVNKAESENRDLTKQEYEELQAINEKQTALYSAAIKKFYDEDKNNILGVYELMISRMFLTEDEFADWYGKGGEAVKNFAPFVKVMQAKANKEATQTGKKYVDFEGINPKDTAQIIKLSDFVRKDKYVLLDFWASWCGPCLKAIPEIKILHSKYASKGLEVIGVVISDKLENHLKAAEKANATWTQIFDSKGEIGEIYGINAIPTLILLDKDGTILVRANEKEEIIAKIESLLGK